MQPLNQIPRDQQWRQIYRNGNNITSLVKYNNEEHVVKQIPKNENQRKICERIRNQNSPHLVKILYLWEDQNKLFILMPKYLADLSFYLTNKQTAIHHHPSIGISIFLQIMYGLTELQLFHRDLKPHNILVQSLNNQEVKVVITDFGLCNGGECISKTTLGTDRYQAPEIEFQQGQERPYNRKVDSWSLGVTLYQIFCRSRANQLNESLVFPYNYDFTQSDQYRDSANKLDFFYAQTKKQLLNIPMNVNIVIRDLIRKLLRVKNEDRPFLVEIYDQMIQRFHEWKHLFPQTTHQTTIQTLKKYHVKQQKHHEKQMENLNKINAAKQLYKDFYINITKIDLTQRDNLYDILFLFLYFGLKKIIDIYQDLNDQKILRHETYLKNYLFQSIQNFNKLYMYFTEVHWSVNRIINDKAITSFFQNGSQQVFLQNTYLRQTLTKKFKNQIVQDIQNAFQCVYL